MNKMTPKDKEDYINNLNIEVSNLGDIERILIEYETGKLTREEFLGLSFLSHSITRSKAFHSGWECRENKYKREEKRKE